MSKHANPSELARETLIKLASNKTPPTPDNYARIYAQISGKPTPYAVGEITAQLGDNIQDVALILDQGAIARRELSTIIDLTVSPPQLIRQGRLSWLEIREVLNRLNNPE